MALGGFIDHMNKTIQQNRALLKRNSIFSNKDQRIYDKPLRSKGEISTIESKLVDESTLKKIRVKLRHQRQVQIFKSIFIAVFSTVVVGFVIFKIITGPAKANRFIEKKNPKRAKYFKTRTTPIADGFYLKTEHFNFGPKSAETKYKNGMKHRQSMSYYQTGEVFRSAVYFYDTLISEVYYYRNGDTIKNFVPVHDYKVHHVTLEPSPTEQVTFDFYDGKMLTGSYKEHKRRESSDYKSF